MIPFPQTLAECAHQMGPRSLWIESLRECAAPNSLEEWLVEEANVRGFFGASGRELPQRPPTGRLSDEDIVVALLSPHALADGRIFKLVVRMVQSGRLQPERLLFRARRERATGPIYWLLHLVPESERSEPLLTLLHKLDAPPRGYRPLDYRYDPDRLVRRPAGKGILWRAPRS